MPGPFSFIQKRTKADIVKNHETTAPLDYCMDAAKKKADTSGHFARHSGENDNATKSENKDKPCKK